MAYEIFSEQRKAGQARGNVPQWISTAGYQLLCNKNYIDKDESIKDRMRSIAGVLSQQKYAILPITEERVFDLLWRGWSSLPTPALTSIGKSNKGMPVSCTGNFICDSIGGFYSAAKEVAELTKAGFGTSSDLSAIRPRGTHTSSGLSAAGVMPVVELMTQTVQNVSQGKNRAGAWAGYLTFEHDDFDEFCQYILHNPKAVNAGFVRTDEFNTQVKRGDAEAHRRLKMWTKVRFETGTGFLNKRDVINRRWSAWGRKDEFRASNLCTEISLPSRHDLSYTCVLSSVNVAKYDEWSQDSNFLHDAFIILNAINELFVDLATQAGWDNNPELARTLKFAREYRAVGMGVLGYHTYLQSKLIPFAEQGNFNKQLFASIQKAGVEVSQALYRATGQAAVDTPARYNYALCAVAPTLSTSLIQGGVSQGIEPVFSNVYTQAMAGGNVNRVNPVLLALLKARGKAQQAVIDDIAEHDGSVQHIDWLSERERSVFKTMFEVDQMQIIRHAAARQPYIDQMQSINLANCNDQKYMSDVHAYAWSNDNIHSLYYLHPSDKVRPVPTCEACEA